MYFTNDKENLLVREIKEDQRFQKLSEIALINVGITTGNKEAVNEVLSEKSKVNLENLREGDETSFRMKDKRALGLDISSGFDDSGEIAMQLIENGADVNKKIEWNANKYRSRALK